MLLERARRILIIFTLLLLPVHEGALFPLLLIHKLVIHSIIQVSIIVLLIDSVLFSAFRTEFNNTTWRNQIGHFFWPNEGWIVLFHLFDLVALIDEHRLNRVEWRQDEGLLLLVLEVGLLFAHTCLQVVLSEENLLRFKIHLRGRCHQAGLGGRARALDATHHPEALMLTEF